MVHATDVPALLPMESSADRTQLTPPMNITLIQLISEQTMQNLVPVLALKPAHVVHLTTPKTAARSAQIIEGARQAGTNTEVESNRLSEMPSIPETSRAVLRAV